MDFTGIPPSLLEVNFISFLASQLGRLVSIDFNFAKPYRVDIVSCLVSVIFIQGCYFHVNANSSTFKIQMAVRQSTACSNCDLSSLGKSESDFMDRIEKCEGSDSSSKLASQFQQQFKKLILVFWEGLFVQDQQIMKELNHFQSSIVVPNLANKKSSMQTAMWGVKELLLKAHLYLIPSSTSEVILVPLIVWEIRIA